MNRPGALIRTVLGDIAPEQVGPVNYHEHLFQVSPLLPGDELTDERRSEEEAAALMTSGFAAMIDATPIGLGRNPRGLAAISRRTGLTIVATSGAHRQAHYGEDHSLLEASVGQLAALFRRDVADGMADSDNNEPTVFDGQSQPPVGEPVRAGLLKAGIGYWDISSFSRRVIEAIGQVHREIPVPVMIHLEHGSATHEVLDLLAASGVPADSVMLAHCDRNPDAVLHAELATRGAYLGYDGFARHREYPDSLVLQCLADAAALGARERLLIGGDVARASRYQAYGGMPGLAYLGNRILPRLRAIDEQLAHAVTVTNPRSALAW